MTINLRSQITSLGNRRKSHNSTDPGPQQELQGLTQAAGMPLAASKARLTSRTPAPKGL